MEMRFFSREPKQQAAVPTAGETQTRRARETIVANLAANIHDSRRANQVRALPGGREMVAEAVRRAAQR